MYVKYTYNPEQIATKGFNAFDGYTKCVNSISKD